MRDVFPYEKGYWYPHLSKEEKEIWERFIIKFPDAYTSCQYDFHIGEAPPFNTLMDDGEDRNQDMLYRLRIDVVGRNLNDVDIIEIKKNAGLTAIAQATNYRKLYMRDEDLIGKVGMVIITDKERPNMDYLCKKNDILLIVV